MRIGPDKPLTHWMLYSKTLGRLLCSANLLHFGTNSIIRPGAYLMNLENISIGNNVVIRPGTTLSAGDKSEAQLIIEDDVLIGPNVTIFCTDHNYDNPDVPIRLQGDAPSRGVLLKRGCYLGYNSVIFPGVIIGKNSVIGAGSIVKCDVPDYQVWAGNPAKCVRTLK